MRSDSPDASESPPPDQRAWGRFQFGLRGALVAFAIGGLYLAWIAAGIERSPHAAIGLAQVWYLGALGVWFLGALGDAIDRRRGRFVGVAIGAVLWMTVVYLLHATTKTIDATSANGTAPSAPPLLAVHALLALVAVGSVLGLIRRRSPADVESTGPNTTKQLVESQRLRRSRRNRTVPTVAPAEEPVLHRDANES